MASHGAQKISPIPSNSFKVGGDTYTPFVYTPVYYSDQIKLNQGSEEATSKLTTGQLWPRGRV